MEIEKFKITEETVPQQPMIYARRTGRYGAENGNLMEKFKLWVIEHGYMTQEAVLLGIAWDNVNTTPPEQCRYDVVLLGDYASDEEWIIADCFAGGKYVLVEIPHTQEAVSYIWNEGILFLSQKYHLDFTRPIIERYRKKLVDEHLCEMMFPVV